MKHALYRAFTAVGATVLALAVSEAALRLVNLPTRSCCLRTIDMLRSDRGDQPAAYHRLLGYVPLAGYARSADEPTPVTIEASGLRSNGHDQVFPGPAILAVGDSFTFGNEVGDADSWPAQLEEALERRVLNGGVFGYGLDQAVLRAEQLVAVHRPRWVVVSAIPDDVRRCEYSKLWWLSKPYFEIVEGSLVLRNVPVSEPEEPPAVDTMRAKLDWSRVARLLLGRLASEWWNQSGSMVRVHRRGSDVAALLVERLHGLCARAGCHSLLVLQPEAADLDRSMPDIERWVGPARAHAHAVGVPVLDLIGEARRNVGEDPGLRRRWFRFHMTRTGNRWVAGRIARQLRCLEGSPDGAGGDCAEEARSMRPKRRRAPA